MVYKILKQYFLSFDKRISKEFPLKQEAIGNFDLVEEALNEEESMIRNDFLDCMIAEKIVYDKETGYRIEDASGNILFKYRIIADTDE